MITKTDTHNPTPLPSVKRLLKSVVKAIVPRSWRDALRRLWIDDKLSPIRRVVYFGWSRYCPICKAHLRRFFPFRRGLDPLAVCPICFSHGRHRMFWLWLPRDTDLFDDRKKKLLQIAPNGPEKLLAELIQKVKSVEYLSGDLSNPLAMVHMDITDIHYPDNFFDVILCSHVLEHVPEDRKAIAELFRVLKPGGWAILQVPILGEETFEDPSVIDPNERMRLFGQFDHVRRCGTDYKNRLESVGFTVEILPGSELFTPSEIACSELIAEEDRAIWLCRKLVTNDCTSAHQSPSTFHNVVRGNG